MSNTINEELAPRGAEPSCETVTVEEEVEARPLVTEAIPLLLEREEGRGDRDLRDAARLLKNLVNEGRSVADDIQGETSQRYKRAMGWVDD